MSKETAKTGTSLKKEKAEGQLIILRPSQLAKDGVTGVIATGVLEKAAPNKFNKDKNDYYIRAANGDMIIINGTTGLAEQLDQPEVLGKTIRVEYNGKVATKNGKGYHDFNCFLV